MYSGELSVIGLFVASVVILSVTLSCRSCQRRIPRIREALGWKVLGRRIREVREGTGDIGLENTYDWNRFP